MPRTESTMANQVFCDISISTDGYAAGPGQTAGKPFGDGPGERLFDGVPPLNLGLIAVRGAPLTTHISYRVLH